MSNTTSTPETKPREKRRLISRLCMSLSVAEFHKALLNGARFYRREAVKNQQRSAQLQEENPALAACYQELARDNRQNARDHYAQHHELGFALRCEATATERKAAARRAEACLLKKDYCMVDAVITSIEDGFAASWYEGKELVRFEVKTIAAAEASLVAWLNEVRYAQPESGVAA